jgi:hypothetical protein
MAELLILFLILLCLVLIVSGIMYKCTDGTTNASDFSFKTCFKIGDETDDKPQEVKTAEVTTSPLLSDGFSMGGIVGSSSIGDEDEEELDYASYMDYYNTSSDGVRSREDKFQICRGIRDNLPGGCGSDNTMVDGDKKYTDFIDIDAKNGLGQCAKICYDQDETIDGKPCNAFMMSPGQNADGSPCEPGGGTTCLHDDKTCRLYWSQSKKWDGSQEPNNKKVYRLKTPRAPIDHEGLIETQNQTASKVATFSGKGYSGIDTGLGLGQHNNTFGGWRSIIVPENFCVHGFTGKNLQGTRIGSPFSGMITSRDITYSSGLSATIKSVDIGSWEDGMCTFHPRTKTDADADEIESATIDELQPGNGSCVRKKSGYPQAQAALTELCDSNNIACTDYTSDQCTESDNAKQCCIWE